MCRTYSDESDNGEFVRLGITNSPGRHRIRGGGVMEAEDRSTGAAVEPFSRRSFVQRAGVAAAAAFLAQMPGLLDAKGLLQKAIASESDLTRDTLNGLLAFILPGDDEYSKAQGTPENGPGAIGAGTLEPFISAL